MSSLIRLLLIWLLVLAVPAQGAAAATMALCGPNHHTVGTAMQHPAPAADHTAHVGGSHLTGEQSAQALHLSPNDHASVPASEEAVAKVSAADKHKCSACASCCSAGAMPFAELSVPAAGVTPTLFADVAVAVDPFSSDGPDRPPRPALA